MSAVPPELLPAAVSYGFKKTQLFFAQLTAHLLTKKRCSDRGW